MIAPGVVPSSIGAFARLRGFARWGGDPLGWPLGLLGRSFTAD